MKGLLLGAILGAMAGWAAYFLPTAQAILDGKTLAAQQRAPWWAAERHGARRQEEADGILDRLFNPPKQERPELRQVEALSKRLVDGVAPMVLRDGETGAPKVPNLTPRQLSQLGAAVHSQAAVPTTATGAVFGFMVVAWFKLLFRRRRRA